MAHKHALRFASLLNALGSLLPRRKARPPAARVVRPWREDALRAQAGGPLSPSRALSTLHAADAGQPQLLFELFDEMLQRWPRLAAVAATRRLALTSLDWSIVSGDDIRPSSAARRAPPGEARPPAGRTTADEITAFCREQLAGIDGLRDALDHLSRGLAYGIAVAELVWQDGRLVDLVPVPFSRLVADPHEPWRLRVRTAQEPTWGVALDERPGKWVVHTPGPAAPAALCGRWFSAGLLRASVLLYLAQNLSFKDWLVYSQIAGMPLRIAQFDSGTPEADKRTLLRTLEALGTDAVAAFSKNIDLKLLEASTAGNKPYLPLQEYCNTEITILWLGQHLTTDLRGDGSRAAAEVHDRVREDLLADDIAAEARTIRRDVLAPLVRAQFGPAAVLPVFRRALVQSVDTRSLADLLAVAVRQLGLRVPRRWAHEALGIPEPLAGETTLQLGDIR